MKALLLKRRDGFAYTEMFIAIVIGAFIVAGLITFA